MSSPTAHTLFDVSDAVCLITGGASGIGLAYAEVMLANGAKVHIVDQDQAAIDAAVATLAPAGSVWGHRADVTIAEQLDAAIAGVVQASGRIDVAFVNAGIGGGPGFLKGDGQRNGERSFEDLPFDQWARVMDVNVNAAFRTMQGVVRVMKRVGAGASSSRPRCLQPRRSSMSARPMSCPRPPSPIWCGRRRWNWCATTSP